MLIKIDKRINKYIERLISQFTMKHFNAKDSFNQQSAQSKDYFKTTVLYTTKKNSSNGSQSQYYLMKKHDLAEFM